jgi:hypothetical protein
MKFFLKLDFEILKLIKISFLLYINLLNFYVIILLLYYLEKWTICRNYQFSIYLFTLISNNRFNFIKINKLRIL